MFERISRFEIGEEEDLPAAARTAQFVANAVAILALAAIAAYGGHYALSHAACSPPAIASSFNGQFLQFIPQYRFGARLRKQESSKSCAHPRHATVQPASDQLAGRNQTAGRSAR